MGVLRATATGLGPIRFTMHVCPFEKRGSMCKSPLPTTVSIMSGCSTTELSVRVVRVWIFADGRQGTGSSDIVGVEALPMDGGVGIIRASECCKRPSTS